MSMPFPNDESAEAFLPQCPVEVTDTLTRKQYAAYRKTLLKAIADVRPMLWPLGEQKARFVLNGFATTLRAFLKEKTAPTAKPLPKAKVDPQKELTTEQQLPAEAGGKPNDGK